jgi:raffinose/stachyose/melibiose transport system substrate-binding protein
MKKIILIIFCVIITIFSTACNKSEATNSNVITIHFPTPQVGTDPAAAAIKELVKQFNEKYEDKYYVVIDEVPGVENYINKIKTQISTGDLPPIVYGLGYNLLDLMLAKDYAVDLTDYVNEVPEWKAQYNDMSMLVNSRDGRIYASSAESTVVGYFYNKELFAKANITKPADTWDEFMDQMQKLKDADVTPLSMQTSDSGWVTQFWIGALVATKNEDGLKFMRSSNVKNFNNEEMIYASTELQKMLQEYTTPDAIGGSYDNAASNFFNEKTAIIANGPWMISDMLDESKVEKGFIDKIGCAIFPGDFVYNAPSQGYIVVKQKNNPELEKACIEFVRFMTSDDAQNTKLKISSIVPSSPTCKIPDELKDTNPLLASYLDNANKALLNSDNLQAIMYPNAVDEMCQQMTLLANGDITPEDFCNVLTQFSEKN